MRALLFFSAAIIAISTASSAQAQMTIDVSKVTCDQYVHHRFAPPRLIGAWLSGYYNAKRDNRILDLETFEQNLIKLEHFCYQEKNFKVPLMQAVEQLLGARK